MTSPTRKRGSLASRAIILACASGSLFACQQDEKIVNYKPFFSGLEGVKTQTPAVAAAPVSAGKATNGEEIGLLRENKDGTVTLVMSSGRNLMAHIQRTLAGSEDPNEATALKNQFAEQVLSEITRSEYHERGLDPVAAYELAKKNEKEIAKLFNRMPMGEYSPNVLMEQLGKNMIRVRVSGQARKGLEKWTGFDMVLEKGNWRLRWFVP